MAGQTTNTTPFPTMTTEAFRAVVLDSRTHKYSSSEVRGGGGYVTTVGGQTVGQTAPVHTKVTHHERQDLWFKDVKTGQERQLVLQDASFPIREGHVVAVSFDRDSQKYERLLNESTGQLWSGGEFNEAKLEDLRKHARGSLGWAIGLCIPWVNFLAGLRFLIWCFEGPPRTVGGLRVEGVGSSIWNTRLAGTFLFLITYVGVGTFTAKQYFWLIPAGLALSYFWKRFRTNWSIAYDAAAQLVEARSHIHDENMRKLGHEAAAHAGQMPTPQDGGPAEALHAS
jgi:hypothetical protein